jgi:hypothetical protein
MLLLTSWFAPPSAKNLSFEAAIVAPFLSSQQHCGVLLNVSRHALRSSLLVCIS